MGRGNRLLAGTVLGATIVLMAASAEAAGSSSSAALYTTSQAQHGAMLYRRNCASCHAGNLKGDVGPALVGRPFRQMASAQNLTAKSLLEVVAQSMPKTNPGALKASQYDAIIAFILQKNGYPAGSARLTAHETGLNTLKLAK